jgi:hypothetical protein
MTGSHQPNHQERDIHPPGRTTRPGPVDHACGIAHQDVQRMQIGVREAGAVDELDRPRFEVREQCEVISRPGMEVGRRRGPRAPPRGQPVPLVGKAPRGPVRAWGQRPVQLGEAGCQHWQIW